MSIDWVTIKPLISSQIATLSGLAPKLVRWVDEPSGDLAGALPVIWLRVSSISHVGIDREDRVDNAPNNQTVTLVGQREFTLSIRVESFTPDIADERHAANIMCMLMARLRRSTAINARAGVFAVDKLLMTKWFSYIESNRQLVVYLLDVLCATVDNDIDTSVNAGNWIGEVQGTGTIKNNDGSTIDTPTFDAKTI